VRRGRRVAGPRGADRSPEEPEVVAGVPEFDFRVARERRAREEARRAGVAEQVERHGRLRVLAVVVVQVPERRVVAVGDRALADEEAEERGGPLDRRADLRIADAAFLGEHEPEHATEAGLVHGAVTAEAGKSLLELDHAVAPRADGALAARHRARVQGQCGNDLRVARGEEVFAEERRRVAPFPRGEALVGGQLEVLRRDLARVGADDLCVLGAPGRQQRERIDVPLHAVAQAALGEVGAGRVEHARGFLAAKGRRVRIGAEPRELQRHGRLGAVAPHGQAQRPVRRGLGRSDRASEDDARVLRERAPVDADDDVADLERAVRRRSRFDRRDDDLPRVARREPRRDDASARSRRPERELVRPLVGVRRALRKTDAATTRHRHDDPADKESHRHGLRGHATVRPRDGNASTA
jgi:hypothetical protein